MWIELLKTKDAAFKCFQRVKSLAETESGRKLRAFRSDRGGEFNSIEFKEYCDEHGVNTSLPHHIHCIKTEWWNAAIKQ
jgi:hypothetical protein